MADPLRLGALQPVPQLTLDAAEQYTLFDQQKALDWANTGNTTGTPVVKVVDRQEYWRQQQANEQARQQIFEQLAAAERVRAPLMDATNLYSRIAADTERRRQLSTPQATPLPEAAQQFPRPVRGGPTIGGALGAVGSVANTVIPYSKPVQRVAGQIGERIGEHALGAATLPGAEYLPGADRVNAVTGRIGEEIGKMLIPTHVWEAALVLLPAAKARSIPELLSAITIGDKDALSALRNAGKRLRVDVEPAVQRLMSEAGALQFGKRGSQMTDEELTKLGVPDWITQEYRAFQDKGALADQAAFSDPRVTESSGWRGSLNQTFEPNAAQKYQSYMSQVDRVEAEQARLKGLSDAAQVHANEIKKRALSWARGVEKRKLGPNPSVRDSFDFLVGKYQKVASERGSLTLGPGDEAAKPAAGAGEAAGLPAAADILPPPPESEAAKLGLGAPAAALPAEQLGREVAPGIPGSLAARIAAKPTTVDEAALQVTEWLRKGRKVRPEQNAMFARRRAEQTAKMADVFALGGSAAEARIAGAGKWKQPMLAPLDITPEMEDVIRAEIRSSTVMGAPQNKISAEEALDAMKLGILPEPDEAVQIGKILGLPFVEQLGKTAPKDWYGEFMGVLGIPQALQTTMDASAILRQMAPLGWTNPAEYFDAIGTIGRAFTSEASAVQVMRETLDMPWVASVPYPEATGFSFTEMGGRLADIGGHLRESEGQFSSLNQSMASRAVEKLPWVKPAERIYNVPINRLRASVYGKWAQNMWEAGERDPKMYKAVANVTDHASGWGTVEMGQIGRGLNAFYAARNLTARFQVLLDPLLQPGSLFKPSARQLAARNLVGFVGANAALLGLMAGSGAMAGKALGIPNPVDVELDPRSGGAFTGKIGNLRVDMTGGYGSIIRLVARLSPLARGQAPQVKNAAGKVVDADPARLVDDFIAGKLGPIPKIVWNALGFPGGEAYAEDFRSAVGLRTAALHLFTPFFVQDVVEAWQQQGAAGAALAAPISFFGGGVNTYQQSESQKKSAAKSEAQGALEQAGVPFSGKEIDFTRHILDAKPQGATVTNRQKIIDALKIKGAGDDASLKELRAAYMSEERVAAYAKQNGISVEAARDLKSNAFASNPVVADAVKRAPDKAMATWRANPLLLQQAYRAGQVELDDEKRRILAGAELQP